MTIAQKRKRKKKKTVLVLDTVHNRLAHSLGRHTGSETPTCYLLGKDSKNIISCAVSLKKYSGCNNMPCITGQAMAKGCIKIYEKKYIPCGIARVGKFDIQSAVRGDSLFEIGRMSKDAIIISITKARVVIEQYNPKARPRRTLSNYAIVGKKGKGRR